MKHHYRSSLKSRKMASVARPNASLFQAGLALAAQLLLLLLLTGCASTAGPGKSGPQRYNADTGFSPGPGWYTRP